MKFFPQDFCHKNLRSHTCRFNTNCIIKGSFLFFTGEKLAFQHSFSFLPVMQARRGFAVLLFFKIIPFKAWQTRACLYICPPNLPTEKTYFNTSKAGYINVEVEQKSLADNTPVCAVCLHSAGQEIYRHRPGVIFGFPFSDLEFFQLHRRKEKTGII